MGVYSRDNVDYQGMIQNMLANRARGAQIRSQGINRQGEIWGNAVNNIGNIASSTIRDMAAQEEAAKQQELENSWKAQQLDFQNRQLAQQKDLQLQQMALSRELAGQQKAETAAANQDENMKNWQIANARLNAAKAKFGRSAGDPAAQAEYADAMFTEQYWRKKAGVDVPDMTPVAPITSAETPIAETNEDKVARFNEALAGEWTDEAKANAEAIHEELRNDPKLYADLGAKLKGMGKTKEGKQADADKYNATVKAAASGEYTYSGAKDKIAELEGMYKNRSFTAVKGPNGKYTIKVGKK
jgi:hypothetical protein